MADRPVRMEPPVPVVQSPFLPSRAPTLAAGAPREVGRVFRGGIEAMQFEPTGALIVACGGRIERLDPDGLETVDVWSFGDCGRLEGFRVLADGRFLLRTRRGAETTLAFGRFGSTPEAFYAAPAFDDVAITSDGRTLVVPTESGVRILDPSGAVRRELTATGDAFGGPRRLAGARVDVSPSGRSVSRWEPMQAGNVWTDGQQHTGVVRGTRNGVPFEETRTTTWPVPRFVSDDRFLTREPSATTLWDLGSCEVVARRPAGRAAAIGGGRLVFGDGYGGYVEHDPWTFDEIGRAVVADCPPHHGVGAADDGGLAVSATHVASWAPTWGSLHVHRAGAPVVSRSDHFRGLSELTVSASGRRLMVLCAYRARARTVDLDAGVRRDVVCDEGLEAPAVSPDGARIVFAGGSILRARTMYAADFEDGDPEPVHPSTATPRGTWPVGQDAYAHAASASKGWVGVFPFGSKRATAKIARDGWRVAASRDGATLAVVTANPFELVLYDITKKAVQLEVVGEVHDAALGNTRDALAYRTLSHVLCVRLGTVTTSVTLEPDVWRRFAFAEDDSALLVADADGLHVHDPATAARTCSVPTGVVPESLVVRGGYAWLLGRCGALLAFAIPTGPP